MLPRVTAQDLLDRVYSLTHLEAFEPASYVAQLADDVHGDATTLAELEARDASLAAAFPAIDTMIARAMRVRLDHALALDASMPAVTRNVFATTIASYANTLDVLAQRVHQVAARGGSPDPAAVTEAVVAAARTVLALRDALRIGVLELVRDRARASVAHADAQARERSVEDTLRKRWSQARRDLEALAADPSTIFTGAMAARMAAYPEQLDDAPAGPEPSIADLIELD
jgi:hypothetical protein